jgi:hypothetical protein
MKYNNHIEQINQKYAENNDSDSHTLILAHSSLKWIPLPELHVQAQANKTSQKVSPDDSKLPKAAANI